MDDPPLCLHRWAGLPSGPQVMGIVNVTPDSFSDAASSTAEAIERAQRMVVDGAALIDIGGESTRPGAKPITPEEEQRRILPVVTALARDRVNLSVDTRHADTMARVLDAGASVINDVSGLRCDPAALSVVAERRCPVILMHMRGTPQTMDALANYDDVVSEVVGELGAIVDRAVQGGVDRREIAVDPGFGFAKDAAQNVELLRALSHFLNLSCPIVAGLSRKRFIGTMAEVAEPSERDAASVAAGLFAVANGASVLRVHDVRSTVQALKAWTALAGTG